MQHRSQRSALQTDLTFYSAFNGNYNSHIAYAECLGSFESKHYL